ncbi:MAG: FIST N-terminal domain-containing protein [Candidatus Omnitrophota bacterium]
MNTRKNKSRAAPFPVFILLIPFLFLPKAALAAGPMKISYGWSVNPNEAAAVDEAVKMMKQGLVPEPPKFVAVFTTGGKYNERKVLALLRAKLASQTRIWGLNSDLAGIAVPEGIHSGLTVAGFYSPSMTVGVGGAKLKWQDLNSYRRVGREAILEAIKNAGKTAKGPPNIILFAGLNLVTDTEICRGIEEITGVVPIWGGNAGQEVKDAPAGDGWCYSNSRVSTGFISVAAIWIDSKVGVAYGYGYSGKTEFKGLVNKADPKKRIIYEIDHRPAADVYNEWTGGKITGIIKAGGGNVPLSVNGRYGLKKPVKKGSSDYVLVGFPVVYPDKSVFVTHEGVEEGTELSLSEFSDKRDLLNKPAIIATIARNRGNIPKGNIAGALFLYCYAQLYVVKEYNYDINPAFSLLSKSLKGAPFSGFFAGGEIGHSPQGGNRMMSFSASVAVFGEN